MEPPARLVQLVEDDRIYGVMEQLLRTRFGLGQIRAFTRCLIDQYATAPVAGVLEACTG
ncbi:MAG: hypothetical protein VX911_05415 [Candidatus Latescibacterota bacterium]|nr:hypothetical protein [Candidatus Latescibacterota bacterium]